MTPTPELLEKLGVGNVELCFQLIRHEPVKPCRATAIMLGEILKSLQRAEQNTGLSDLNLQSTLYTLRVNLEETRWRWQSGRL